MLLPKTSKVHGTTMALCALYGAAMGTAGLLAGHMAAPLSLQLAAVLGSFAACLAIVTAAARRLSSPRERLRAAAAKLAHGDLNITPGESGEHDPGSAESSLSAAAGSVQELRRAIRNSLEAVREGRFDYRNSVNGTEGDYRAAVDDLNTLLTSISDPAGEIRQALECLALNDPTAVMTSRQGGEWQAIRHAVTEAQIRMGALVRLSSAIADGDLHELELMKKAGKRSRYDEVTPSIIRMMETLRRLTGDIHRHSVSAAQFRLADSLDAAAYNGEFRSAIEDLNRSLAAARELVNELPLPAIHVDHDMNIVSINKAGAAAAGADAAALIGSGYSSYPRAGDHCVTTLPVNDENGMSAGALLIVRDDADTRSLGRLTGVVAYQREQSANLAAVLNTLAAGDLSAALELSPAYDERREGFEILAPIYEGVDNFRKAVVEALNDMQWLTVCAASGKLAERGDIARHRGEFGRSMMYLNSSLGAVSALLEEGNTVLKALSSGDLTMQMAIPYTGQFEAFRKNMNSAVASLDRLLGNVAIVLSTAADASTALEASAGKLTTVAHGQLLSARLVAGNMQSMAADGARTSCDASSASELAAESATLAAAGEKALSDAVAGVQRIADVVDRSGQTARGLGDTGEEIVRLSGIIDDAARRADRLALNSAVGSTVEGGEGRAFALLASGMRDLMGHISSTATHLIGAAKNMQKECSSVTSDLETGKVMAAESGALAGHARMLVNNLVKEAREVAETARGAAAANTRQTAAMNDMSLDASALAAGSAAIADDTQKVRRSAHDLRQFTRHLQSLVSGLRLTGQTADPLVAEGARAENGVFLN